MGAEEALSKDSCCFSCLGWSLQLFVHVQRDAGGMEGHGSQTPAREKRLTAVLLK